MNSLNRRKIARAVAVGCSIAFWLGIPKELAADPATGFGSVTGASGASPGDAGQPAIATGDAGTAADATGGGGYDAAGGYAWATNLAATGMATANGGGVTNSSATLSLGSTGGYALSIGAFGQANGGNAGAGGTGGTGGDALATTSYQSSTVTGPIVSETANGGNGGGADGSGGAGGSGGNATATADAVGKDDGNGASASVQVVSGGGGVGVGGDAGAPGQIGYFNDGNTLQQIPVSANAVSNYGGPVSASVVAIGGPGGVAAQGPGGGYGHPSAGASVTLNNAVSGYGGGDVTLNETARAGNGAESWFEGSNGGNATADLTHSIPYNGDGDPIEVEPKLTATTSALGGQAGAEDSNVDPGVGGTPGDATAYTSLSSGNLSSTQLYSVASAQGGGGNSSFGAANTAVTGGTASATAIANTTTPGMVDNATASASGGNGGNGREAGTFPDLTSVTPGGAGGDATAQATAQSAYGMGNATATTLGGDGGSGLTGGAGGNATATAEFDGGPLGSNGLLMATAQGGAGGPSTASGQLGGMGGSADAVLMFGVGESKIEASAPGGMPNGQGGGTGGYVSLSIGSLAELTVSSMPQQAVLKITGTASICMEGIISSGSLVIGDGTNSVFFCLETPSGTNSTLGSFIVNTGSIFQITTDSSATTSIGVGNTNNGKLTVLGTGATVIGGMNGTGSLSIGDGVNPTTLQLSANSGGSSVGSLTINANSALDITNNHLFINYGSGADPIASIAALLASGYANGSWNGAGINSSTAAANAGSYGLGYADSADPGNPAGLPSGTIEIAYTLLGDADLNRTVNGIDFGILAANFNKAVTGWDQGDFNYDNIVNGIDFADLAANFNKGAAGADVAGTARDWAALDAFAAANGLLADVPEPGMAGIFGVAGMLALKRRRRRG
jgi:hypothetical protein